jgi:hypothetical protein
MTLVSVVLVASSLIGSIFGVSATNSGLHLVIWVIVEIAVEG